ncbi:MAG TPA: DUF6445 family protein [Allosphingosinicella sp.]|nr:DUF6445 family protein [Allosphingosinicella sp.]
MTSPSAAYDFTLAPSRALSLERIGGEREPVLLVEGAMSRPADLVDYAASEVAFEPVWGPSGGYPGVRAPAPLDYVEALVRALDPSLRRAFGLERVKLARAECSFSLVTLPPERLAPLQRIPHVDTTDPLQFALLHYLCDARHGGTAFYRHRATGFETLTPERQAAYEAVRSSELREAPSAYIDGDSAHYERTAAFDAAFDRILVYRSRTFHSGRIATGQTLSADPRRGRLTANIFINYRPL